MKKSKYYNTKKLISLNGISAILCELNYRNNMDGLPFVQYFIDKDGKKQIVFDYAWAEQNDMILKDFHIPTSSQCHFINGVLEIDIPTDEYWGKKFLIDKSGKTEYKGDIQYQDDPSFDFPYIEDFGGYEKIRYWNIEDENLRDAIDDDIEALNNID